MSRGDMSSNHKSDQVDGSWGPRGLGRSGGRGIRWRVVLLLSGLVVGLLPTAASAVNDVAEVADAFGGALARGDFDGNGFADLAVGVPGEDIGEISRAGAVNVIYGSAAGLTTTGDQFWSQNSAGIEDTAEAFDEFGTALTSGDFDGDGFADLAVGVSGEGIGEVSGGAGAVNVIYGSAAGLTATGDQFWSQDSPGIEDAAEDQEGFGWSLTAANFGKTSQADLAVGVPFEGLGATSNAGPVAGAVNVIYGSAAGLSATGDQFWSQDTDGIQDTAEGGEDFNQGGDGFGASLAAANFGKGLHADLAVGVPNEDLVGKRFAGAVNVIYGSAAGLSATGDQFWSQDSAGIENAAEEQDGFGGSLTAAKLGKTSQADLAVGVSGENLAGISDAGAINVIYGSAAGLSATGDQLWSQDSAGIENTAEGQDFFGERLAAGNFGKTSQADLAVGVSGENLAGISDAGAVNVIYGSAGGLSGTGDQFWHQSLSP